MVSKVTRAELHEVGRFAKGIITQPKLYPENDGRDITVHEHKGKAKQCRAKQLKIVSWNVMRNYHAGNVQQTIEEMQHALDPDVWLFQEVPYTKGDPVWKHWKPMDGKHVIYVPDLIVKQRNKVYNFDSAGLLVASKHPIKEHDLLILPTVTGIAVGKVERAALHVKLACAKMVDIYNVHLENACRPSGRLHQIRQLLKSVKKGRTSVIGGDFNTMFGPKHESLFHVMQQAGFKNVTGHKHGIISGFDYFFIRGGKATSFRMQQRGSDHNAVLLVIDL